MFKKKKKKNIPLSSSSSYLSQANETNCYSWQINFSLYQLKLLSFLSPLDPLRAQIFSSPSHYGYWSIQQQTHITCVPSLSLSTRWPRRTTACQRRSSRISRTCFPREKESWPMDRRRSLLLLPMLRPRRRRRRVMMTQNPLF